MKVFLLEDDFSLNKIITNSLKNRGFFVHNYHDGYKAVEMILNNSYDLFILDLNVIGFDGHQILEIIRKSDKDIPVIIISAQIDIENIQKSYNLGCNDYIKKPFDFEELFLRIQYHVQKLKVSDNFLTNLDNSFTYDLLKQELYYKQQAIELSIKEKLLMTLFVQNLNNITSIEMIHEYVWDSKEMEAVSMRSLIHKLKKKLKSGMIINVRGEGYKLIKH
ncbi:response regulator transcription factor [Poseidonibacter lekithochrous]|uniref:response regulator transcription factor n=1 Tax=Poseidonibacter TaxID=2321187 RepID=UPI001C09D754|nr:MULTISPECIES: response regulator transcription factor [Poseidonibacter]MBU3013948.1 response regulator transcription factor [Poseidonibacter lekithochrous]MDO6827243.1 response regulator transcription factor [Poseidonibacter sp. 1_MG-2023]